MEAGFELHHAEKGYVMLTKWLPPHEENKLPENASHQVGIGAFVLNERREMLLVQEKSGPLKGKASAPTRYDQQVSRHSYEEKSVIKNCHASRLWPHEHD